MSYSGHSIRHNGPARIACSATTHQREGEASTVPPCEQAKRDEVTPEGPRISSHLTMQPRPTNVDTSESRTRALPRDTLLSSMKLVNLAPAIRERPKMITQEKIVRIHLFALQHQTSVFRVRCSGSMMSPQTSTCR